MFYPVDHHPLPPLKKWYANEKPTISRSSCVLTRFFLISFGVGSYRYDKLETKRTWYRKRIRNVSCTVLIDITSLRITNIVFFFSSHFSPYQKNRLLSPVFMFLFRRGFANTIRRERIRFRFDTTPIFSQFSPDDVNRLLLLFTGRCTGTLKII